MSIQSIQSRVSIHSVALHWAAAALLAVGAAPNAHAANVFWDTNGASTGLGGAGAWDASTPNWYNANAATSTTGTNASAPFTFTLNDDAYFAGTAGTVTLTANVTLNQAYFQTNGYTLTGNSRLIFAGTNRGVDIASGVTTTLSLNMESLQYKTGAGTLILTGITNYDGSPLERQLLIQQGTVQVGNGGTTGGIAIISGTNNVSYNLDASGTELIFNRSDSYSLAALIIGGSTEFMVRPKVTFNGTGTVTLGRARQTSSLINVDVLVNSMLVASEAESLLGQAGEIGITINSGGSLIVRNESIGVPIHTHFQNGAVRMLTINSGGTLSLIDASGNATRNAVGILNLSGGTLITGATSLGVTSLLVQKAINVTENTTITAANLSLHERWNDGGNTAFREIPIYVASAKSLTFANAAGTSSGGNLIDFVVSASDAPILMQSGGNLAAGTYATGINKQGLGTLTLRVPNTYTGKTIISEGILAVMHLADANSSLGNSSLADPTKLEFFQSNGTLRYTGSAAVSSSRSFVLNGFNPDDALSTSARATFDAASGAGAWTISSQALVSLNGQVITESNNVAFPDEFNYRTLRLTASNAHNNLFEATLSSADLNLAPNRRGFTHLVKNGTGKWTLGSQGLFLARISAEDALTVAGLDGFIVNIDAGTLGFKAGTLNTYGSTNSNAKINIADGARLAWELENTDDVSARIVVPANATAKLDVGANQVTFASAPTVGTGGKLQKEGLGSLTLDSTVLAASLNIDVLAGRLEVNGTAGDINVANGAELGGTGIFDDLVISTGGTISPGNSVGALSASTLMLNGGSLVKWEVRDATAAAGIGYDTIQLSGNLNLSGASSSNKIIIKLISLNSSGEVGTPPKFDSDTIYRFTFASGLNLGSLSNITDVFAIDTSQFSYDDGSPTHSALWSLSYNMMDGMVTLTAVPEPSTYAFGIGALALAAAAFRRRRKKNG